MPGLECVEDFVDVFQTGVYGCLHFVAQREVDGFVEIFARAVVKHMVVAHAFKKGCTPMEFSSKWAAKNPNLTMCFGELNAGSKTQREVSEPGPPTRGGSIPWHTPRQIVCYGDTARTIPVTTFVRGEPVFRGGQQGQG